MTIDNSTTETISSVIFDGESIVTPELRSDWYFLVEPEHGEVNVAGEITDKSSNRKRFPVPIRTQNWGNAAANKLPFGVML